jgi:hypothetical protein
MRLLSFALAAFVSMSALAAQPEPVPHLHNTALAFADFWDANHAKPPAEQVAAFKATVAPTFPGFYDAARFKSFLTPAQYDERIVTAVRDFPAIRADYVRKAQQFGAALPAYLASFKATFPDANPPADIYVLHSLGEMDGGMREIDGRTPLIFGVDRMATLHGNGNESAFFHHELFHAYHLPRMQGCADAHVWSNLWIEGLATYVSTVMNPQASDQERLLALPDNMATRTRAMLPQAWAQLEPILDSEDEATYANLFLLRGTAALPRRRGYYLGFLVAQEAGKTRDVRALARLDCAEAKALVFSTVHRLREGAR